MGYSLYHTERMSSMIPVHTIRLDSNPSCHLLEIHGLLRFNGGENPTTLGEEETHGRKNYSDILPV